MHLSRRITHFATSVALAATLALGGCGGVDGIDLNGKLFDMMGISSSALEGGKKEPQLAARAPLVLPPDSTRLPEPGAEQAPTALAEVNDPDLKKAAAAKERERLHLAYCRGEIQWKETVHKKTDDGTPRSPYGPCPSLFGGLTSGINKQ
jgi:hypothetical protein